VVVVVGVKRAIDSIDSGAAHATNDEALDARDPADPATGPRE